MSTTFPNRPKPALFDYAYCPSWGAALGALAGLAAPERWDLPDNARGNVVLDRYIKRTFERVLSEGKLAEAADACGRDVSAFNTGLFTPHYDPIFGCFEATGESRRMTGWATERDPVMRSFAIDAVAPADWFDGIDPVHRWFDRTKDIRIENEHLLDEPENLSRFPADFRDLPNRQVQLAVLDRAVELAKKRVQLDWTLAVLQIYFGVGGMSAGRVQLLLPLTTIDESRVDVALVLDLVGATYVGRTNLKLEWAYSNARLLRKPEAAWLESAWVAGAPPGPGYRIASPTDQCPVCGNDAGCSIAYDNRSAVCGDPGEGVVARESVHVAAWTDEVTEPAPSEGNS